MLKIAARFLLLGMLTVRPAHAIVSMESLHLGQPASGWSGQVQVGASGASGNTEKYDAAAGLRLQFHQPNNTSSLIANANYGRNKGTTNTDNEFYHLRHIYDAGKSLAVEGFLQQEKNRFTRLAYRGLGGAGLRYSIVEQSESGAGFLGLGAIYVREKLLDPAVNEQENESIWRGNIYLVFKLLIGDHSRIVSSTYYQPKISESHDYRALEDLVLSVDINKSVSLNLGVNLTHDNEPPQGVEKTDTVWRTSLGYTF